MKRILLLVSFLCMIALMGVMANERASYTADEEPVLILCQQSTDQGVGIGELLGVTADPSKTDFSILPLKTVSHEISLSGLMRIDKTIQTLFVNFSPGIAVSPKTAQRFLC